MPITLDQIVDETLLARHGGVEPRVESAWKTEIDRRIAEIEAGETRGIPVEESLDRIRQIAGL